MLLEDMYVELVHGNCARVCALRLLYTCMFTHNLTKLQPLPYPVARI